MRAREPGVRQLCRYEWLIVARWGENAEYISLSWTDYIADAREAPIQLRPRRTVIGVLSPDAQPIDRPEFRLSATLPANVVVGSRFIAASGYIRLSGTDRGLRVRSKGSSAAPDAPLTWDLSARRGPWIGEFIDAPHA